MKKYKAFLDYVSHEKLDIPEKLEEFTTEADDLESAVKQIDSILYAGGIILKPKDFVIDDESVDGKNCWVSFSDSEAGLQITYEVDEI